MATITTSQYLDSGVARTSGETWSISNAAVLTIRTDSRVHANAPANMTGTIGAITLDQNSDGGVYIDGTKVRWMEYDNGSGNVPAIGTLVTQGGVSGYLLGVWANTQSAPTAVGAALPITGFLKFREVTGSFTAFSFTDGGVTCRPIEADRVGWIEVALKYGSSNNTLSNLGLKTNGDWFNIGTTSGSASQILQVPTNGGGSGTLLTGIQIETAPGSGVYEWYPATISSLNNYLFNTTAMGTDIRAKAVHYIGNGQVRIGHNGTGNVGYVPPAGCNIRVPNIFLRQGDTTTGSTNVVLSNSFSANARFTSTYANIELNNVLFDLPFRFSLSKNVKITNSSFDSYYYTAEAVLEEVYFENVCGGWLLAQYSAENQSFLYGKKVTIKDTYFLGMNSSFSLGRTGIKTNFDINNFKICLPFARTTGQFSILSSNTNEDETSYFRNLKLIGYYMYIGTSNAIFENTDYIENTLTTASSASSNNVFNIAGTSYSITIDGLSFGFNGAIANCHTYNYIFNFNPGVSDIRIQNIGTYLSPLNCGSINKVNNLARFGTFFNSIQFKKVYITSVRSGLFNYSVSNVNIVDSKNLLLESVGDVTFASHIGTGWGFLNAIFKSIFVTATSNSNAFAFGSFFQNIYKTTTTGELAFLGIAPTTETEQYYTLNRANGNAYPQYGVSLPTIGDYIILETPYWVIGYTGLTSYVGSSSTGSHTYQYAIDTGSGYSDFKTLSTPNLSAEVISATTGFKMKLKVSPNASLTSNVWSSTKINMSTTALIQEATVYPLDLSTLSFTNLQPGSEVRVYDSTDPETANEIGGTESTTGSTFSFEHSSGGITGVIAIFALGYRPIYFDYTFSSSNESLLIQQELDRNYNNPV
jgi:hypothetical protein